MAEHAFDIVIIGGGPAGYVGAIRAGQLGYKVACVERGQLGGVCNTWGCIPTKALLAAAELYTRFKHDAKDFGIEADNIRHDFAKVIARSRQVASLGDKGIGGLFKKNKVAHFVGHARIVAAPGSDATKNPGKIEVHKITAGGESSWDIAANNAAAKSNSLEHTLTAKHIIIATGAMARQLPGAEFDGDKIIGSKDAMNLKTQPRSLLVVGAGAIGMEFAYFYNAFGTKVTVVEMMDRLLPIEDHDVSKAIEKAFRKQNIEFHTATKTQSIKKTDAGVEMVIAPLADEKKTQTLTADKVLIAIGVRGRYDGLFDPAKVNIETFKDHIKVDRKNYQTNLKGVYAVGDVNGPPWLAHVASEEAVVCVETIAAAEGKLHGHKPASIDYDSIPGCTYCHPQVASIGLTEQACKDKGIKYKVGSFPLLASGKARALGETEGFIKIIAGEKYGEILGCHMIGENVTELIAEICLARRLEATADEIIETMHAHPTLSESIHEAALGTQGRMLHY